RREILVRAGQTGKKRDERHRAVLRLRRQEDGECHIASQRRAGMFIHTQRPAETDMLFGFFHQYITTLRMDFPSCIRSNALLMSSSGIVCVIRSSILILPSMYQSTIFGTSVRPRAPPKAEPRHTRPVTSWKGRVEISSPAPATPMMIDSPQPLCAHSSAWRMTVVLPMHSNE